MNGKSLLFLCLSFFITTSHAEISASSKTNFTGMITIATCNIVVGDDDQAVHMGEVSSAELDARGRSSPISFTINLYGCNASDRIARIVFDQVGAGASGSAIPVQGVRGIALSLLDGKGAPIYFGRKSGGQKIITGDNHLLFSAYLVKTGTIIPGAFSRVLHYTIYYE
ncbi:fimbrial protein [Serratia silvae]|uniref:Type 1 fimbrial protein n=1 Tax=Serratia silvae TaxID=2824122 RepID=A0ABT0KAE3_9GAMM|nr:fimbrial protein [Serratia silvae]MCL1028985.1 type 1 fimbrial protein [Serratia silvae]